VRKCWSLVYPNGYVCDYHFLGKSITCTFPITCREIWCISSGLSGAFSQLWFADPLGGAIVGLIILRSWLRTGREQISVRA
jgi:hypothetical protein